MGLRKSLSDFRLTTYWGLYKMENMDEINKIIETSGNNFHCKVLSYLKERGWHVLVSPYYTDNISDKPREIDLIAEKVFGHGGKWSERRGTINIKLFIECKYVSQMFSGFTKKKCEKQLT